jgi:hypothetical protein
MEMGRSIPAKLVKRVSKDGIMEVDDHLTIGDPYVVFPATQTTLSWGHKDHPGRTWHRECVFAINCKVGNKGFLPVEFLEWHDDGTSYPVA